MLKRLLIAASLITAMTAGAADSPLTSNMKIMGEQMKILALALLRNQPTPIESIRAAGKTLATNVELAKKEAPSTLLSAGGTLRQGAETEYQNFQKLMTELGDKVAALNTALAIEDEAAARTAGKKALLDVVKMNKLGHKTFNVEVKD